jgi:transcription elongation factor Elf1
MPEDKTAEAKEPEEKLPRIFMTQKDTAAFTCPKCGKVRIMDVSQFKHVNKSVIKVKCKCPCGHKYSVLLERRKEIRKEVAFIGSFSSLERGRDGRGRVTVKDLSRSGLRFKMHLPYQFKIGENIMLEFTLNDRDQSLITRKVIIRSQHGDSVGASFASTEHYDKLGPYLLYSL